MAATTTVRVYAQTHRQLQELAREDSLTMPELLDRLVTADWRRRLFERANEAYAALQADPDAWAAELAERGVWDAALEDGLSEDVRMPSGEDPRVAELATV